MPTTDLLVFLQCETSMEMLELFICSRVCCGDFEVMIQR